MTCVQNEQRIYSVQVENQIKLKCSFNCNETTHFLGINELIAVPFSALPGNPDLQSHLFIYCTQNKKLHSLLKGEQNNQVHPFLFDPSSAAV